MTERNYIISYYYNRDYDCFEKYFVISKDIKKIKEKVHKENNTFGNDITNNVFAIYITLEELIKVVKDFTNTTYKPFNIIYLDEEIFNFIKDKDIFEEKDRCKIIHSPELNRCFYYSEENIKEFRRYDYYFQILDVNKSTFDILLRLGAFDEIQLITSRDLDYDNKYLKMKIEKALKKEDIYKKFINEIIKPPIKGVKLSCHNSNNNLAIYNKIEKSEELENYIKKLNEKINKINFYAELSLPVKCDASKKAQINIYHKENDNIFVSIPCDTKFNKIEKIIYKKDIRINENSDVVIFGGKNEWTWNLKIKNEYLSYYKKIWKDKMEESKVFKLENLNELKVFNDIINKLIKEILDISKDEYKKNYSNLKCLSKKGVFYLGVSNKNNIKIKNLFYKIKQITQKEVQNDY